MDTKKHIPHISLPHIRPTIPLVWFTSLIVACVLIIAAAAYAGVLFMNVAQGNYTETIESEIQSINRTELKTAVQEFETLQSSFERSKNTPPQTPDPGR